MFLEETCPYRIVPVDIGRGEQFEPEFLAIAPNNRIPAIVDHEPPTAARRSLFESGAILLYLAEKTGRFIPADLRGRVEVLQWLFWQMGGLGPMAGQNHHFAQYAPEKIPYAIDRYVNETNRLYGVLDQAPRRPRVRRRRLLDRRHGLLSLDRAHERQGQNLDDFPNLKRWKAAIRARPATERAYANRQGGQRRRRHPDDQCGSPVRADGTR